MANVTDAISALEITFKITVSTLLIIEIICGLSFNMAVLTVYYHNKRTMWIASNMLLTNLNIVDVLVCIVSIPCALVHLLEGSFHSPIYCYVQEATIAFASSASATNLLLISADRYETILRPLKRKINLRNVKYILLIIWMAALIGFICPFLEYIPNGFYPYAFKNHSIALTCNKWMQLHRKQFYELYYTTLALLCTIVMFITYYKIFTVAKRRLNIRSALFQISMSVPGTIVIKPKDSRVTKVTLIIVLTFIMCWGPHIVLTIVNISTEISSYTEHLEFIFLTLAYSTTIFHPLLYAFMRKNFRDAFQNMFPPHHILKITPTNSSGSDKN